MLHALFIAWGITMLGHHIAKIYIQGARLRLCYGQGIGNQFPAGHHRQIVLLAIAKAIAAGGDAANHHPVGRHGRQTEHQHLLYH